MSNLIVYNMKCVLKLVSYTQKLGSVQGLFVELSCLSRRDGELGLWFEENHLRW